MDRKVYIAELEKAIYNANYDEYYCAKCLRYANQLLDNDLPVIFDVKHLALLIGIETAELTKMIFSEDRYYTETKIPKKSGGFRNLYIPSAELKYIQHWVLTNILNKMNVSEFAMGFRPNKSILDNARIHINKKCIVNMDIKDFFPSITFEMTYRIFAYYGYTNEMSFILAKLCTYKGRLPQGSPASPCISNIVCLKLDSRLSKLAMKYQAVYSRYADDLTFSSDNDIKSIIPVATKIINDENYKINDKKSRIAYPHQRQEVTGLLVNGNKVRIPKKYKKELYKELYYCAKFGVQGHLDKISCTKAFYKEHVYGKIYFVNMVEPEEAKKLFDLADKVQWEY